MSTQHLPREFRDATPIAAEEALGTIDIASFWSAAMTNIERLSAIIASRPNYKPDRGTDIVLTRPECEHQCERCYMGCAIAPARLKWWENELAQACGSAQMGRA